MFAMLWAYGCTSEPVPGGQDASADDQNSSVDELAAPVLSADVESLTVDMCSEQLAMVFTWNNLATEKIFPTYELVLADEKDSKFENAVSYVCNNVRRPFSHAELDKIVRGMGYSLNEELTLKAFVFVSANGYEPVVSNVVSIKLQVKVPSLYPIGSATPYGWDTRYSVPMKKNGDVFTCDLPLKANSDLKFIVYNTSWWPGIVNKSADPYTYQPMLHFTELTGDLDRKFFVNKDGDYRITVNTSDIDNITFTADLLPEASPW